MATNNWEAEGSLRAASPTGRIVLISLTHEKAYWRAAFRARIEFRRAGREFAAGRIPGAEISIVMSNRETAQGLEKARARGIEARVIPSKGLEREAYDRLVVAALQEKGVDLVCLAGFMRLLSPYFVARFPQRILNIHPSLLPAFPGLEAQRQALEYGVKFSGCTVHFVDENLDAGPIVLQAVVPVEDDDTAGYALRAHPARGTSHLHRSRADRALRPVPHRRPPRAACRRAPRSMSDEGEQFQTR